MDHAAAMVHPTVGAALLKSDEFSPLDVLAITIFSSLLCICIVAGHLLERFRYVNEAIVSILLGLLAGCGVLLYSGGQSSILQFNEEIFFIYLLPPIVFNAGFQVKKKQFFRNFAAIMALGVLGVFVSFGVISAGMRGLFKLFGLVDLADKDYLALGAIFAATDSVCVLQVLDQDEYPLVYSLVFGEGVVNDASSVVLFRAVQKLGASSWGLGSYASIGGSFVYLFLASTGLGIAVGLLSAFIIKVLYLGRHSTDREVALMVLMAYLSYLISELCELSGILTIFFCGVVMSHYTWHNITESSRVTTKHMFATMSFLAETFIFVYVGMDALDTEKWNKTSTREVFALFWMLLLLTVVSRALFVFPLCALLNIKRPPGRDILVRHQTIVWWSGLMRGAVSVALAFNAFTFRGTAYQDTHATIIAATMLVVLFSNMVFGLLTRPLLDWLLPPHLRRHHSEHSLPPSPKNFFADLGGKRDGPEAGAPLLTPSSSANQLEKAADGAAASEGQQERPPMTTGRMLDSGARRLGELVKAGEKDVHAMWRWFDVTYMRPLFGGRGFNPYSEDTEESSTDLEPVYSRKAEILNRPPFGLPRSLTDAERLPAQARASLAAGDSEVQPLSYRKSSSSLGRLGERQAPHLHSLSGLSEADPPWPDSPP